MSDALDRLAGLCGLQTSYRALSGRIETVGDDAKRAVLAAMGVAAGSAAEVEAALAAAAPVDLGPMAAPEGRRCYLPGWLAEGRAWGVACQIYALRSTRNWGVGDFADLARLAEIAAAEGADFVGVNPLHALFLAEPARCSPFSPSNRQFLNPLYIAVDWLAGADALAVPEAAFETLRELDQVRYRRVGEYKQAALEELFRAFAAEAPAPERDAFESFCLEAGQPLYLHALFEALSEAMVAKGLGSGWHSWPEDYRRPDGAAVRAFAEASADRIAFHSWLQFVADRQLAETQRRALAAGMRIGLYVDLAVGVAPDGSATWSDRDLVVPAARIGAPPDYFNAAGQDWGLAPLSPSALARRGFAPYREAMAAVLRHAGAIRIDHVMSLYRLFWIADGFTARDGVYVRYPFADMLRTLAEVSQERRAVVIGEDLGVVPEGFREVMEAMDILSYRVLFFERRDGYFLPPDAYPHRALACISTHDLPTLAGWWGGHDIAVRSRVGLSAAERAPAEAEERAHDRRRLLGALADAGLMPAEMAPVLAGGPAPEALPLPVAVALHRYVARSAACLFAVPLEDLVGATEQVNVPGTSEEHPNWRQKLPVDLEALPQTASFQAICAAVRDERPRPA